MAARSGFIFDYVIIDELDKAKKNL